MLQWSSTIALSLPLSVSQIQRRESMVFTIDNTPKKNSYLQKGLNRLRSSTRKSPSKGLKKSPAQHASGRSPSNRAAAAGVAVARRGNTRALSQGAEAVAPAAAKGPRRSPRTSAKSSTKSPRATSKSTTNSQLLTTSARKVRTTHWGHEWMQMDTSHGKPPEVPSAFQIVLNMKRSPDLHFTLLMFLTTYVSLYRWWAEWRSEEVSGTFFFFVFHSNYGIVIICTFSAYSFHFIQINLLSVISAVDFTEMWYYSGILVSACIGLCMYYIWVFVSDTFVAISVLLIIQKFCIQICIRGISF